MSKINLGKILRVNEIKSGIFYMEIESPYIVKASSPGQFINIKCAEDTTPLLRRPISIADVNKKTNSFSIYFKVVGEGTKLLSQMMEGDLLDFIGPLGNGFKTESTYENVAIVGGGIGIFPLLLLLKNIKSENIHSFLGFDCEESILLEEEFSCLSKMAITTEDLSKGKKRLVTEALKDSIQKGVEFNMIFACGPKAMLIEISKIALENNIKCQLSLEEKMGCGIGSCLVCACKTKIQKDSENSLDKLDGEDWTYSRVCKEGPVFMGSELIWE